jgi:hypothetical protein
MSIQRRASDQYAAGKDVSGAAVIVKFYYQYLSTVCCSSFRPRNGRHFACRVR